MNNNTTHLHNRFIKKLDRVFNEIRLNDVCPFTIEKRDPNNDGHYVLILVEQPVDNVDVFLLFIQHYFLYCVWENTGYLVTQSQYDNHIAKYSILFDNKHYEIAAKNFADQQRIAIKFTEIEPVKGQ